MFAYPACPQLTLPSEGHRRLELVARLLTRADRETASEIAGSVGRSRQWLYQQVETAAVALESRRPGPVVGWREQARLLGEIKVLKARNAELLREREELATRIDGMVAVSRRRRDQVELVCFAHNVSLRGTQEILEVAWGREWRPDRDGLHRRLRERGRLAHELLSKARAQVVHRLPCVMADDVFFHRADIKVVAEPESMAMLNLGRWEGSSALDWVVWLEEYDQLALLVSDLGSDLVGAARRLSVPLSADFFHESRHFERELLAPLSHWEERARKRYWELLERATRPRGAEGPTTARIQGAEELANLREDAFAIAVEVVDRFRSLYELVNPSTGRLWSRAEIDGAIDEMIAQLNHIDHTAAKAAMKHLETHRHRYGGALVMVDRIQVELRPDSSWSTRGVLNGLLRLWSLHRKLQSPQAWAGYAAYKDDQRLARDLERRLRRACTNLDQVALALRRELRYPKRSSSGVESLNSKLRVLQTVHKNVSDEMLGLVALAWNLTPRKHPGRRRGKSPYGMLGVDIGQGDRPWYEVLLSAQDEKRAAA